MRKFNEETLEMVATRLKLLGEPTRLKILNALREGERSVGSLVEETATGQANVSKHLGLLHRNHVVDRRKDGLTVYYSIADASIFELCSLVCDSLQAELDARQRALAGP